MTTSPARGQGLAAQLEVLTSGKQPPPSAPAQLPQRAGSVSVSTGPPPTNASRSNRPPSELRPPYLSLTLPARCLHTAEPPRFHPALVGPGWPGHGPPWGFANLALHLSGPARTYKSNSKMRLTPPPHTLILPVVPAVGLLESYRSWICPALFSFLYRLHTLGLIKVVELATLLLRPHNLT